MSENRQINAQFLQHRVIQIACFDNLARLQLSLIFIVEYMMPILFTLRDCAVNTMADNDEKSFFSSFQSCRC